MIDCTTAVDAARNRCRICGTTGSYSQIRTVITAKSGIVTERASLGPVLRCRNYFACKYRAHAACSQELYFHNETSLQSSSQLPDSEPELGNFCSAECFAIDRVRCGKAAGMGRPSVRDRSSPFGHWQCGSVHFTDHHHLLKHRVQLFDHLHDVQPECLVLTFTQKLPSTFRLSDHFSYPGYDVHQNEVSTCGRRVALFVRVQTFELLKCETSVQDDGQCDTIVWDWDLKGRIVGVIDHICIWQSAHRCLLFAVCISQEQISKMSDSTKIMQKLVQLIHRLYFARPYGGLIVIGNFGSVRYEDPIIQRDYRQIIERRLHVHQYICSKRNINKPTVLPTGQPLVPTITQTITASQSINQNCVHQNHVANNLQTKSPLCARHANAVRSTRGNLVFVGGPGYVRDFFAPNRIQTDIFVNETGQVTLPRVNDSQVETVIDWVWMSVWSQQIEIDCAPVCECVQANRKRERSHDGSTNRQRTINNTNTINTIDRRKHYQSTNQLNTPIVNRPDQTISQKHSCNVVIANGQPRGWGNGETIPTKVTQPMNVSDCIHQPISVSSQKCSQAIDVMEKSFEERLLQLGKEHVKEIMWRL